MTLRFGTDGVRGVANAELTPELVLALGRAAARVLGGPTFLIGRDTRASGPLLQAALTAGIASEGVDVIDLGVLPTPGVAVLAAADGLPSAMISASHNPFSDNGIKLFAAGGRKLTDQVEARLEAELEKGLAGGAVERVGPVGAAVGRAAVDGGGRERYQRLVLDSLGGRRLDGVRVALDCAHGAASMTGPELLRRAGADVVAVLADRPDGTNINNGYGSTDPAALQAAVLETGADAGLALDGDADRVIAVDHTGSVVDGDQMIAALALDRMARGALAGGTVVVTVMTNLGFHLAMAAHGVAVHTTPVGDRYVLEALDRGGWSLGGEQSGHVIFRDLATTGDGVLTGLQLLDAVVRAGRPLAELARGAMVRLPQVLCNVPVAHPGGLAGARGVWDEVKEVEACFGDRGRVVLRGSGTEPLVRVMVEAPTHAEAEAAAARLARAVAQAIG
ncbi:MAG: phosphoglucosamine mutase [Actinomycetota bacterium]|nr:phosphoglucosamine mutase [Actinomycetota bacterium]